MPEWWNWYTRWIQNPLPSRACRFESGLWYHSSPPINPTDYFLLNIAVKILGYTWDTNWSNLRKYSYLWFIDILSLLWGVMNREIQQRLQWVRLYQESGDTGLVCRRCGISRPTLRKWWRRYQDLGEAGLNSLSRRPKTSPSRKVTSKDESLILDSPAYAESWSKKDSERA